MVASERLVFEWGSCRRHRPVPFSFHGVPIQMIVVEFRVDHPLLRTTLCSVPDVEIEYERSTERNDGRVQAITWIHSDDFEAVSAAIENDTSVEHPQILAESDGRRLYRFDLTSRASAIRVWPRIVAVGGVPKKIVGSENGWHARLAFPDRDAARTVFDHCRDLDVGISL